MFRRFAPSCPTLSFPRARIFRSGFSDSIDKYVDRSISDDSIVVRFTGNPCLFVASTCYSELFTDFNSVSVCVCQPRTVSPCSSATFLHDAASKQVVASPHTFALYIIKYCREKKNFTDKSITFSGRLFSAGWKSEGWKGEGATGEAGSCN